MVTGDYYFNKNNGSSIDEKKLLAESGKVLGFDSGLNPVMLTLPSASLLSVPFTTQTSIVVTHNFGVYPLVQVLDNSKAQVIPYSIVHTTANSVTITFIDNTSGTVIVSAISSEPLLNFQEIELQLAWKVGLSSYQEFTFSNGLVTQIDYWQSSAKTAKLFTKTISYTGSNPTTITVTDETTLKVLTTTIAYTGNTVTNITKSIA